MEGENGDFKMRMMLRARERKGVVRENGWSQYLFEQLPKTQVMKGLFGYDNGFREERLFPS